MALTGILHITSILAATAFLSCFGYGARERIAIPRVFAAAVCALAAFFFLPVGSLPPLVNIPYGALFFFCFFACSLWLLGEKKLWLPYLFFGVAFGVFACFFYFRGVPGSVFNFGTFIAMPFWQFATVFESAGCAFLAVITFLCLRLNIRYTRKTGPCGILVGICACALWVSLFIPFNAAPVCSLPERALAGLDSVLFWMKIIGVYRLSQGFPSDKPWSESTHI